MRNKYKMSLESIINKAKELKDSAFSFGRKTLLTASAMAAFFAIYSTPSKAEEIDPFTYLQSNYAFPGGFYDPAGGAWGDITGADAFDNGTKLGIIYEAGAVSLFEDGASTPYLSFSTGGSTGITEVDPAKYPGQIAVTSNNGIIFFDLEGSPKGYWGVQSSEIKDITYDSENDRIFLSTGDHGNGILQADGSIEYLGSCSTSLEYINLTVNGEGTPITDMLQTSTAFRKIYPNGTLEGLFNTNLGQGDGIFGTAYTNDHAYQIVKLGSDFAILAYDALDFQPFIKHSFNNQEPSTEITSFSLSSAAPSATGMLGAFNDSELNLPSSQSEILGNKIQTSDGIIDVESDMSFSTGTQLKMQSSYLGKPIKYDGVENWDFVFIGNEERSRNLQSNIGGKFRINSNETNPTTVQLQLDIDSTIQGWTYPNFKEWIELKDYWDAGTISAMLIMEKFGAALIELKTFFITAGSIHVADYIADSKVQSRVYGQISSGLNADSVTLGDTDWESRTYSVLSRQNGMALITIDDVQPNIQIPFNVQINTTAQTDGVAWADATLTKLKVIVTDLSTGLTAKVDPVVEPEDHYGADLEASVLFANMMFENKIDPNLTAGIVESLASYGDLAPQAGDYFTLLKHSGVSGLFVPVALPTNPETISIDYNLLASAVPAQAENNLLEIMIFQEGGLVGAGRFDFSEVSYQSMQDVEGLTLQTDWQTLTMDVSHMHDGDAYMTIGFIANDAPAINMAVGLDNITMTQMDYPVGDFDKSFRVDMTDFGILGYSWLSIGGDDNFNPACDISNPSDDVINIGDLKIFVENWLEGR